MIGRYRFSSGGVLIAESENLITTVGKKAVVDYLAGFTQNLAGAIVLGVGTTAANVADKALEYEVARVPIRLRSPDYTNYGVIFKAQVNLSDAWKAYEAGLVSSADSPNTYSSKPLLTFDSSFDSWSAGTFVATNSRQNEALRLAPGASATTTATLSNLVVDLSGYSNTDQFNFAFYTASAFVSSVVLRLKVDASNYYSYSIATPSNGVYGIYKIAKSAFSATGSPSWANITQAEVAVTSTAGGSGIVDFDGLRIEDLDSYRENDVLVSRSILGAQITKTAGLPLDIEYTITI
ncbi:MAG TPA: hypothetical protein VIY48_08790 [Candidatus Paceibacterota bacterium]|jgi:hypothetical protein